MYFRTVEKGKCEGARLLQMPRPRVLRRHNAGGPLCTFCANPLPSAVPCAQRPHPLHGRLVPAKRPPGGHSQGERGTGAATGRPPPLTSAQPPRECPRQRTPRALHPTMCPKGWGGGTQKCAYQQWPKSFVPFAKISRLPATKSGSRGPGSLRLRWSTGLTHPWLHPSTIPPPLPPSYPPKPHLHWSPPRDALEGGEPPSSPSRAPSLCPATVPLTASASLNGICNR